MKRWFLILALGCASTSPSESESSGDEVADAPSQSGTLSPTIVEGMRFSDGAMLITRAAMDEVLADQTSVFSVAQLIPSEADGQTIIRLYGIRANSLLSRLGFQNGDALQRVNGQALRQPNDLDATRDASELQVDLQRGGQSITQTIRVVDALP